jgi:hypothetical protein
VRRLHVQSRRRAQNYLIAREPQTLPFNVSPWFKLFLGKESAPPANMDAWEAAMREDLMMRRQVLNYQQKAALR